MTYFFTAKPCDALVTLIKTFLIIIYFQKYQSIMRGIELIEPTELYNLLNQLQYGMPCVVNEYYLALFDSRKLDEFNESHVITSKFVNYDHKTGFDIPKNFDYAAVQNLVVIDNRASSLKDVTSPAIVLAEILWKMGSKYPVKVVNGGYEEFSGLYPFLRSQKMLWTQGEIESIPLFPIEIDAGFLYIGLRTQAESQAVGKYLRTKAHINVTTSDDTRFTTDDMIYGKNRELVQQLLHIPVEDSIDADLYSHFSSSCTFIEQHHKKDGKSVLIYSDLGISRSVTIALAYLIYHHKIPLKEALVRVKKCHYSICPNQSFVKSLLKWEVDVLGSEITVTSDLGFLSYE